MKLYKSRLDIRYPHEKPKQYLRFLYHTWFSYSILILMEDDELVETFLTLPRIISNAYE